MHSASPVSLPSASCPLSERDPTNVLVSFRKMICFCFSFSIEFSSIIHWIIVMTVPYASVVSVLKARIYYEYEYDISFAR